MVILRFFGLDTLPKTHVMRLAAGRESKIFDTCDFTLRLKEGDFQYLIFL